MYVSNKKILGGYYARYIALNVANGSLVAAIQGTNLRLTVEALDSPTLSSSQ
jgi:hypothetical protein